MKVRVRLEVPGRVVDEIAEAPNAEGLIAQAKARVVRELGWKGLFLNAMSDLSFAQLAVRLYNERYHANYAIPQTADEFLDFGKATGNLTVLEA